MGRLARRPFATLLAFREAQKPPLSQEDAAKLVGITQAHWSRLENGLVGASPRLARRIAEKTGVPAETLLDWGEDESSAYAARSPKTRAESLGKHPESENG